MTDPPPPGGGPPRATLAIQVGVAPDDDALAASLGWQNGVPGASVNLLRVGTNTWLTGDTDAGGEVSFPSSLPGAYRLFAGRTLTVAEAQAVGEPVRAFGDGRTIQLSGTGTVTVNLDLLADRPGDLLIGEISGWSPPVQETGNATYGEAHYFEIYNNSTQTRFLDGMIFGHTFRLAHTNPAPCPFWQAARTDPDGIYTRRVLAFPGSGSEYPIMPGEVKLIPIAAIDHTVVHPELFDLTGADFEMRGAGSADNPAVPDMLEVGLAPFVTAVSGISVTALVAPRHAFFLAEPVDLQALPILFRDPTGAGWVRIPADRLLDVTSLTILRPDADVLPCIPSVHADFDRYEGGFYPLLVGGEPPRLSFQRRILRFEGHAILQNANTSAVDFVLQTPTPGTLPLP